MRPLWAKRAVVIITHRWQDYGLHKENVQKPFLCRNTSGKNLHVQCVVIGWSKLEESLRSIYSTMALWERNWAPWNLTWFWILRSRKCLKFDHCSLWWWTLAFYGTEGRMLEMGKCSWDPSVTWTHTMGSGQTEPVPLWLPVPVSEWIRPGCASHSGLFVTGRWHPGPHILTHSVSLSVLSSSPVGQVQAHRLAPYSYGRVPVPRNEHRDSMLQIFTNKTMLKVCKMRAKAVGARITQAHIFKILISAYKK